jgi:hypothetical protein
MNGLAVAKRIADGGDITQDELEEAICIALIRRGITDEGGRYVKANKRLVEQIMKAAQAYADTVARDAVAGRIGVP